MSSFACPHCGMILYDTSHGYVTGCEHYPVDAIMPGCSSHGLSSLVERGRAGGALAPSRVTSSSGQDERDDVLERGVRIPL